MSIRSSSRRTSAAPGTLVDTRHLNREPAAWYTPLRQPVQCARVAAGYAASSAYPGVISRRVAAAEARPCSWSIRLKLTPQQVAAAKARGFVLFPATQGQIDRMTMQRRVFDVDGRPHVVSRDGLYFETHATLAPVIADAEAFAVAAAAPEPPTAVAVAVAPRPAPAPSAAAKPEPEPEPSASSEVAPEPQLPLAVVPERPAAEPAVEEAAAEDVAPRRVPRRRLAAKPEAEGETRKPARRRTMVERAEELFSPPPEPEPGHVATEHTLSLPVDDSAQGTEAAARRRQRVADAPRWQVAGAIRRGRQPRAT